MDTYLTTYRKDFRWPVVPPTTFKSLNDSVVLENKLDPCCKEVISPKFNKPEVHQIQLSSLPSAANTDNQPDGFLGQLYDSYPYLYNVKKGPSDDAKLSVFRQRFITTYQRDFCTKEDIVQKEKVAEEKRDACCCKTEKEQLQDETRLSKLRKPTPKLRVTENSKDGAHDKEGALTPKKLRKPGVSEYMDSIHKTGELIVQRKLLTRKPK